MYLFHNLFNLLNTSLRCISHIHNYIRKVRSIRCRKLVEHVMHQLRINTLCTQLALIDTTFSIIISHLKQVSF